MATLSTGLGNKKNKKPRERKGQFCVYSGLTEFEVMSYFVDKFMDYLNLSFGHY